MLKVREALESHEKAFHEHISSLLAHEEAKRDKAIADAVGKCSMLLEDRIQSLHEFGGASSSRLPGLQPDSTSVANDARGKDARPATLLPGHQPAFLELDSRVQALVARDPVPLASLEEATSPEDGSSALMSSIRALERDVLALQGELVMLQARTQVQGVSGSIFSLRVAGMEVSSRLKYVDLFVAKEAEVRRVLDTTKNAQDQGRVADLCARMGMRVERSQATGELRVSRFSLVPNFSCADLHVNTPQ